MTSIAQQVEDVIQEDIALVDALTRDVASLRSSARWLIDRHDIDASEEAVVSALRRYTERNPIPPLTCDRDLLPQTRVDVHTGLCLLSIPRTMMGQEQLPEAVSAVPAREPVAFWPCRKLFKILVEEECKEAVQQALPPSFVERIEGPLSRIKLRIPDSPNAASLLGQALASLVHSQIEIVDVYTCIPECSVLVREEDTSSAYDSLARLCGQASKNIAGR